MKSVDKDTQRYVYTGIYDENGYSLPPYIV